MRRLWPRVTTIVLTVVVVGLAVAAGWLSVVSLQKKDDADQRAKAMQSARQTGVNLMTLNSATAQQDLERIMSGTTGGLKDKLGSQSKVFLDQLKKTQAKSTVDDVQAAVLSMDDDSAEVMVSLNGTVTNAKVKNGATRAYRYLMDLTRVDDRWLVSGLEVVP